MLAIVLEASGLIVHTSLPPRILYLKHTHQWS